MLLYVLLIDPPYLLFERDLFCPLLYRLLFFYIKSFKITAGHQALGWTWRSEAIGVGSVATGKSQWQEVSRGNVCVSGDRELGARLAGGRRPVWGGDKGNGFWKLAEWRGSLTGPWTLESVGHI